MKLGPVFDWFPPGALTGEPVRLAASAVVARWAARWFRGDGIAIQRMESGGRSGVGHILVDPGSNGRELVIDHALTRGPTELIAEFDKNLLAAFSTRILDDLATEFAHEFGMPASPGEAPVLHAAMIHIGDARGRTLVQVLLSAPAARALVRRAIPKRATAGVRLMPLSKALMAADIGVEMRLGKVRLSMQSLRDLTVGDVILLDRRVEDGLDLAICGSTGIVGRVDIEGDDQRSQLRFRQAN